MKGVANSLHSTSHSKTVYSLSLTLSLLFCAVFVFLLSPTYLLLVQVVTSGGRGFAGTPYMSVGTGTSLDRACPSPSFIRIFM